MDFTHCEKGHRLYSLRFGNVIVLYTFYHGVLGQTAHGIVYWDRDGFAAGMPQRDLYEKKPF